MTHQVKTKKLGMKKAHRDSFYINQIKSLIISGAIKTTEVKAKVLKANIDKFVTLSKRYDKKSALKVLSEKLNDKEVAKYYLDNVFDKLADRNSGYTSTVKLYNRPGDNALLVKIAWNHSMELK